MSGGHAETRCAWDSDATNRWLRLESGVRPSSRRSGGDHRAQGGRGSLDLAQVVTRGTSLCCVVARDEIREGRRRPCRISGGRRRAARSRTRFDMVQPRRGALGFPRLRVLPSPPGVVQPADFVRQAWDWALRSGRTRPAAAPRGVDERCSRSDGSSGRRACRGDGRERGIHDGLALRRDVSRAGQFSHPRECDGPTGLGAGQPLGRPTRDRRSDRRDSRSLVG